MLIATIQGWHQHHAAARTELRRRRDSGEHLLLAAHSLVECYSVLTRFPPPQRLTPSVALNAIRTSFIEKGVVIGLPSEDYWSLLESAVDSGVAGGRIFDAVIAATAVAAKADVLLTFNVRDFRGLVDGIELRVPSAD